MLKASILPCLIHQGIESTESTESTEAPVRPPVPCRSRPWPVASGSPAASAAAVAPPGSPRRSVALSHRRWAAWCCRWSRSWWDQGWAVESVDWGVLQWLEVEAWFAFAKTATVESGNASITVDCRRTYVGNKWWDMTMCRTDTWSSRSTGNPQNSRHNFVFRKSKVWDGQHSENW